MSDQELDAILRKMRSLADPDAVAGMARYGIVAKKVFGLSAPMLRSMAREIGRDHDLAQRLWATEILEARTLAALIDESTKVTEKQMERWVADFDSWAICDACCSNLFDQTPFAWKKAVQWSTRKKEFEKRAAFSMMAVLAVHDKETEDDAFIRLMPVILRESTDERNFVKKAVNWALRQIGKRNLKLNKKAIHTAREMHKLKSSSAKWIASDALRELTSVAVQSRLKKRNQRERRRKHVQAKE